MDACGGLGSAGWCGGRTRRAPSPRGPTELPPGSLASRRPRAPVCVDAVRPTSGLKETADNT